LEFFHPARKVSNSATPELLQLLQLLSKAPEYFPASAGMDLMTGAL
jgi:hypothetical protein